MGADAIEQIRRDEVQAIGAAISLRNWQLLERAYNVMRDKIDAALAQSTPAPTDAVTEAIEENDTGCPPHCCCCDHYEPCCDCGEIKPSRACIGEKCWCGAPASKKVGEEILFDDPNQYRHNLTRYICARHYAQLMGPLGARQVGLATPAMHSAKKG